MPTESIGDLEYHKFEDGEDGVPTIRTKTIDGFDLYANINKVILTLERIEAQMIKMNAFNKEFFGGDVD